MSNKASILIVDDDVGICKTMSNVLKQKGYDITTTDNGQSAIELSKERAFDVILMDVKMPVMSGVETSKKIKQNRPSAVVLFMTAFAPEDLAKDMVGEDAYAVIQKPYNIDVVINRIQESIGGGESGFLITLVDADMDTRNTMQNALKAKGYSVTVCKNGEEAITLARKKTRDIFFIDMELPILSSLETYLEIKKVNPKAVVVLMTAYRQKTEEIVCQALEKGVHSCLYKPFDIDEAIQIIEEIVKKKQR